MLRGPNSGPVPTSVVSFHVTAHDPTTKVPPPFPACSMKQQTSFNLPVCNNLAPANYNGHDSMQGRGKIQIAVNYLCSSLGSSYTALCTVFHLGPVCLCRPPCCTWLHSLRHSSGFGLHQCHPTLQLPITWDYTHIASPSSLYLIIFLP